jgi:hypothetical protein
VATSARSGAVNCALTPEVEFSSALSRVLSCRAVVVTLTSLSLTARRLNLKTH